MSRKSKTVVEHVDEFCQTAERIDIKTLRDRLDVWIKARFAEAAKPVGRPRKRKEQAQEAAQ